MEIQARFNSHRSWRNSILNLAFTRKKIDDLVLIVGVYVDGLVIIGGFDHVIEEFKRKMKPGFSMTYLGLLDYCLGIEVNQLVENITLGKSGYATRILEKMGMASCHATHTPMEPT